jgi:phosphatidylserine decarboxylase
VVIFPAIIVSAMVACLLTGRLFPLWAVVSVEVILVVILLWSLAFFRDPYRLPPLDKKLLLAPADGKITDIETIEENEFTPLGIEYHLTGFIGAPALRVGIFLSIFDAHINRAPCNAKIEKVSYRKGKFKNAANPKSAKINESNDLYLVRTDPPDKSGTRRDRLIVRQIGGAIARRIVCQVTSGQNLTAGEKFGMIKFGSRTELYVPANENTKCLVKIGDKVKAGLTPLVRYEPR